MTTVPKPADLTAGLTLKYDAWNRLVEVKDGTTVVGKYEYDGLNRRILNYRDFVDYEVYEHYYYNASWQVLETRFDFSGNPPEGLQPWLQYVWSARYIDALVLRDQNTDSDGLCDDERLYYLTDANFNVTALVDTGGTVLERYVYDPYGKVTIYWPDWSSTLSASNYYNRILYTGREYDPETGLYNYRRRYYHAELGRFISRDPIGYGAGDANLYRYVHNRPTNAFDPGGTQGVNCRAKRTACYRKSNKRKTQCHWDSGLVCLIACSWYCKDMPEPLPLAGICFAACETAYLASCAADLAIGRKCCKNAFNYCQQNNAWPGTFWRLIRGCPIGY